VLPYRTAGRVHTQSYDTSKKNIGCGCAGSCLADLMFDLNLLGRIAGFCERRDELVLFAYHQAARGHASGSETRPHLGAAWNGIEPYG